MAFPSFREKGKEKTKIAFLFVRVIWTIHEVSVMRCEPAAQHLEEHFMRSESARLTISFSRPLCVASDTQKGKPSISFTLFGSYPG